MVTGTVKDVVGTGLGWAVLVCCVMLIKLMTVTVMIDAGGVGGDGKHVLKVFGREKKCVDVGLEKQAFIVDYDEDDDYDDNFLKGNVFSLYTKD